MRAMRDDPLAASAAGGEIRLLRMIAFVLASVYGGVAGVLYAGLINYIAPETFSIADMFLLLAMVIIGGRRVPAGGVPRRGRGSPHPAWSGFQRTSARCTGDGAGTRARAPC